MGVDIPVKELIELAYNADGNRIEWPAKLPDKKYDFLVNLPAGGDAAFRQAVKKELELTAHGVKRERDVLVLTVKTPGADGLKPSARPYGRSSSGNDSFSVEGCPIQQLIGYLEFSFGLPIKDETGLTGKYDVSIKWPASLSKAEQQQYIKERLAEQYGLDLTPATKSIDVLLVEWN